MFEAMSSEGATARSWYTVSMPARRASPGERNRTGFPSRRISPRSGWSAPESDLIKVDLPAPLSPITATISSG
jgi:hypothetical protein